MSRTKNAIKNAFFGLLGKILNLIFGFASRTVFIYILGNTYLGVNGLYSEILSLLSFAELGFGSAITFTMYKPVAENEHETVVRLLSFFKTVYRIVAIIITVLGLSVLPFLPYVVKGADWLTINELRIYFLFFLFNTVIGYLVSYKYTYLNALQKNYVQINIDTVVNIISFTIQIIVIVIFKNFLLYLLVNSLVLLSSRLFITIYLDKKYPILKEQAVQKLSKEERQPIYKEVRGLAMHQFASVAVHSTDNVLISTFTSQGITSVGLISNYTLLINSVLGFVTTLFNSVVSGFGNLVASSTIENFRKVFKEINFVSFWIYGFCSIAFWILIPPFITLWIGADKVINEVAFTLMIINCYFQGQSTAYHNARIAKGNFNMDKWWAVLQAITNLIVSVICVNFFDLVGIYIGTVVSRLVYIILRPYSTYRFLFGESSVKYYKKMIHYFLIVVFAAVCTKTITNCIFESINFFTFVLGVITVFVIPNTIFYICSRKTYEFEMCKVRMKNIIQKGRKINE